MNRVDELEHAVRTLSPKELADFRDWFSNFDAEIWEAEIEADARSGKLDFLINEARDDIREGRTEEL